MNRYLITAFASLLPDGGLPDEIVYLPEGNHAITPFVDGKPKKITVRVPAAKGAQIAASLQADLEKRQAANVRPWFDFEHKGGASSALPRAFPVVTKAMLETILLSKGCGHPECLWRERLNRGPAEALAKRDAARAEKYREGLAALPPVGLPVREEAERIVLETAPVAVMVPLLPDETEPKPEPTNRILPRADQDRTLAQAIAHYRTVPPPDGTVDGDEDPLDYAEQFREFGAESRRLGVLFDGLQPEFEGGREHDLIFDRETGTVLKFTKPSRAGYEVEFADGRPNLVPGLPVGFLKRLELHWG